MRRDTVGPGAGAGTGADMGEAETVPGRVRQPLMLVMVRRTCGEGGRARGEGRDR